MEQEDSALSSSDKEMKEVSTNIEDIDKLATKPPQKLKSDKEDFIEEKLDRRRMVESQKSIGGGIASAIISIYGATILLCFAVIGLGVAIEERKEILTLIITSQATLIGSVIGFYFGKNQ